MTVSNLTSREYRTRAKERAKAEGRPLQYIGQWGKAGEHKLYVTGTSYELAYPNDTKEFWDNKKCKRKNKAVADKVFEASGGVVSDPLSDTITEALSLGNICVMPPQQNGSKRPYIQSEEYQTRCSTADELEKWYFPDQYGVASRTGFGIVCGSVSENLEALIFNTQDTYPTYRQSCIDAGHSNLIERMETGYSERTPDGINLLYRCADISGNVTLATCPDNHTQALIETQGEGGFIITAPSSGTVHPSGKPYILISGSLSTIPRITQEDRKVLHSIARTFNAAEPDIVEVEFQQQAPVMETIEDETPSPDFPQAAPILEPILPAAVKSHEPLKSLFMSFNDMMTETLRIKKLIGKLIQRGCTCQLFGPSGGGKTFVALDMSLSVATGGEWNGIQCEQGLVIYFNGEGREGFKLRCRAWNNHHGIVGPVNFYTSNSAITFDAAGIQQVIPEVCKMEQNTGQHVALIVIDTLARHMDGDENSTQHMSEFIKQVDGLRDKFPGSTALIVHHTGNSIEATGRSRGSSALKAAVDVEIQCMNETITFTKAKDAALPVPIGFTLKVIDLGFDEEGEQVDSCVIEYGETISKTDKSAKSSTLRQSPTEKTLLRITTDTPGITVSNLRDEYCQRTRVLTPEIKVNSLLANFRRAMEGLESKNLAYVDSSGIVRSGQRTVSGQLSSLSTHTKWTGQDTLPKGSVHVVQYADSHEHEANNFVFPADF